MAWYGGHLYLMRRFAEQLRQQEGETARPRPRSDQRIEQRLNADMAALLEQDLANVEAGIYPLPADHDGSLLTLIDRSRLFFRDLPDIYERRKRNATHEVLSAKTRGKRPDYYLQNFHFPVGRLADRGIRRPLRHAGRSAVQGNGERDEAAGAAAACGSFRRA
jgi:hypothetical protein